MRSKNIPPLAGRLGGDGTSKVAAPGFNKGHETKSNIIAFPRRLTTCRTCSGIYRPPPPTHCPDCRYWNSQVLEHERYVAAMREVR